MLMGLAYLACQSALAGFGNFALGVWWMKMPCAPLPQATKSLVPLIKPIGRGGVVFQFGVKSCGTHMTFGSVCASATAFPAPPPSSLLSCPPSPPPQTSSQSPNQVRQLVGALGTRLQCFHPPPLIIAIWHNTVLAVI